MFEYGRQKDIERLNAFENRGGGTLFCKLDKMPEGNLSSMEQATICDLNQAIASTVTSRYYKGIGAHKDNMVLEVLTE